MINNKPKTKLELQELLDDELDYVKQLQGQIIDLNLKPAVDYLKFDGGLKSTIYMMEHCFLFSDKLRLYYQYLILSDFHASGAQIIEINILKIYKQIQSILQKEEAKRQEEARKKKETQKQEETQNEEEKRIQLVTKRLKFLIFSIIKYGEKISIADQLEIGNLYLRVQETKQEENLK